MYKIVHEESLGQGAEIIVYEISENVFELWEVPLYGGEERFSNRYDSIEAAVAAGRKWT